MSQSRPPGPYPGGAPAVAHPAPAYGHSVLQVPVPPLEDFVRGRHAHYDPEYVSADPAFVHAHVTVLGPFLRPSGLTVAALERVGEIVRGTAAFDFSLERIDTFPTGIIHLLPEPEAPFRVLTARLWAAFPECPPYAAQFADVRPHLTLDATSHDVTEASTLSGLGGIRPASCRAERVDLAWYEPGGCRVLHTWRLEGS